MSKRNFFDLSVRQRQRIVRRERTDFVRLCSIPDAPSILSSSSNKKRKNDDFYPAAVKNPEEPTTKKQKRNRMDKDKIREAPLPDSEDIDHLLQKDYRTDEDRNPSQLHKFRDTPLPVSEDTVDLSLHNVIEQLLQTNNLNNSKSDGDIHVKEPSIPDSLRHAFKNDLARWAVECKVELSTLSKLLFLLRNHMPDYDLPRQGRTLLKTPRYSTVISMDNGEYCHFGLKKGILRFLKGNHDKIDSDQIDVQTGVDGFPVSAETEGWPIMGRPVGSEEVFLIGMFCGPSKPASANNFLRPFVDEAIDLVTNGIEYNGKTYRVRIHTLICDAVAKSYLLYTKGHAGYSSCPRCTVEGDYINNRMCFLETDCTLRTDRGMERMEYDDYQHEYSILNEIPYFGLVTRVPYDYMHLLCIGVFKKMIKLWSSCPIKSSRILSGGDRVIFSNFLLELVEFIPQEFCRRPRSIDVSQKWKATESRVTFLYLIPVALNSILGWNHKIMLNCLSLFVAVRLFLSTNDETKIEYANSLIHYFVQTFKDLYGEQFVSHNIHGTIHLEEDVKEYGSLECFSAFRFENFIRIIKTFLRKSGKPLQQLFNRYMEMKNLSPGEKELPNEEKRNEQRCHTNGPLLVGCRNPQYSRYYMEDCMLSTEIPDNCCKIGDDIIEIHNFATTSDLGTVVIGKKFLNIQDLFEKPCPSSSLGIHSVKNLSNYLFWPVTQISCKYVKLPMKNQTNCFAVIPLLHCSSQ